MPTENTDNFLHLFQHQNVMGKERRKTDCFYNVPFVKTAEEKLTFLNTRRCQSIRQNITLVIMMPSTGCNYFLYTINNRFVVVRMQFKYFMQLNSSLYEA